jgi:hypothetical protein
MISTRCRFFYGKKPLLTLPYGAGMVCFRLRMLS